MLKEGQERMTIDESNGYSMLHRSHFGDLVLPHAICRKMVKRLK
jgi:hypothetical protein